MKKRSNISLFAHKISVLINNAKSEVEEAKWEEFTTCFAHVRAISDNKFTVLENISFGDIITEEYFNFKIRYIEGLTKEMRILFRKRNFEIKRIINNEEKNRILSIIALEV